MIRVLIYILILAVLAYGGMLLVQNPGHIVINWFGEVVEAPAALIIGAIALAAVIAWTLARFVFGLPSFVKIAARQRRREKGYKALSRGLIAVGAGDGHSAGKAASQANRHLKDDPLAIMLRAQAAHMNGEGHVANAAFEELAQREDTRVLGLRGLHAEATRRGDEEASRHFAAAAHQTSPLPWSAQAVLEHRASGGDWEQALATVETSLAARLIDKGVGERQRAVLETAIAYDKELADPEKALVLARSAIRRAPDLAPPVVLAARLLTRRNDIRKASKLIERAWPRCQHPDIAQAYLDVRPGDSTQDRLSRAQTLMGIATFDPVSRTTVARAALANKDFEAARKAMAPLVAEGKRPTVRQCLLMAELEESEHGDDGLWREWVARASRAPLDPAWICDGTVYDHWAPASPKTGQLDAFQWQVPAERLGPAMDAIPVPRRRPEPSLPAQPKAALEHHDAAAEEPPVVSAPSAREPTPAATVAAPSTSAASKPQVEETPQVDTTPTIIVPVSPPPAKKPAAVATPAARYAEDAATETGTVAALPVAAATPAALAVAHDTSAKAPPAEPTQPVTPLAASPVIATPQPAPASSQPAAVLPRPSATAPQLAPASPTPAPSRAAPPVSTASVVRADPVPGATARPDPNPRISLPPETLPAERNPEKRRTLFHRRMTSEAEARIERIAEAKAGNGQLRGETDLAPGNSTSAGPVSAKQQLTEASSTAESAAADQDMATSPNTRITLLPEILAERQGPDASRPLFHRRLTPEAEARAERIAEAITSARSINARTVGINGAARTAKATEMPTENRPPVIRPNGRADATRPASPAVKRD